MSRILMGLILVVLGAGWIIALLADVTIPWALVFAVAVILIGMRLVAGPDDNLGFWIMVGIVAVAWAMFLPTAPATLSLASSGVGDRTHAPIRAADLPASYELGIGTLELDLSRLEAADESVPLTATVGMGDLVVVLPCDLSATGTATAGVGDLAILGDSSGGVSLSRAWTHRSLTAAAAGELELETSVGIGTTTIEVPDSCEPTGGDATEAAPEDAEDAA